MPKSIRLNHIENLVSSYYKNDEEYRTQYGVTINGLDLLNESAYLSHRYHWIRASYVTLPHVNNFKDLYEDFIKEQGDFNLYSYYLSPNSPIKYPEFGINQYKCSNLR